ncbi:hypothetical protein BB560_002496 [Smittium megazygosporum]|uniref:Uncharacterized protein n=1 Tax=Smittium megazygosporum TaxID=133381 RepID=A0A2T9YKY8_9FUNG|nr:hypothetical protein BB560_006015 [Smittium megazygosporum]PVV03032.1 hypothetical protein BB560_002496 [Smittium megazygosporum]
MNTQNPLSYSETGGNNECDTIESPKEDGARNNPGKRKRGSHQKIKSKCKLFNTTHLIYGAESPARAIATKIDLSKNQLGLNLGQFDGSFEERVDIISEKIPKCMKTGLNPETELNALNDAQNIKDGISLSRETDPNKTIMSESDIEMSEYDI